MNHGYLTGFLFLENIIGFADDTPRERHLLYADKEKDLCMLFGVKEENEKFINIKLAESTLIGEDVYTVAAPDSIAGPGKRLIFTGFNEERIKPESLR